MEQDFMKYEICKPRDPRFIQMLADEYNNTNISLHDLSLKYHTDAGYQFKIHGIPKRSKGVQRSITRTGCIKYNWDGKEITNEKEAYIFGLFLADGYVGDTQLGIRLKKSDIELLKEIRDYFSSELTIKEESESYSIIISSKQICSNFINNGMLRHKTGKNIHIPSIDTSLIRHFIRGYFDGDGSVFKCSNGGTYYLKSNICCVTIELLEEIQTVLASNGIEGKINKENRIGKILQLPKGITCTGNLDMYRLFIRKKHAIEKFYHYMYNDCTICIERKRKIFEDNFNLLKYIKTPKVYVNTELTN